MSMELEAKARQHWKKWLPRKTRELEQAGQFEMRVRQAAARAEEEIRQLMESGAQRHEAEEMVLPEYILLPPEREAVEAERDEEARDQEKKYRKMMA